MDTLRSYAIGLGLPVVTRQDGTFYVEVNGRAVYSVIYDRFTPYFETWNFKSRYSGHRSIMSQGRHVESVKRSLRKLRHRYV